jgi:hypothetical protein
VSLISLDVDVQVWIRSSVKKTCAGNIYLEATDRHTHIRIHKMCCGNNKHAILSGKLSYSLKSLKWFATGNYDCVYVYTHIYVHIHVYTYIYIHLHIYMIHSSLACKINGLCGWKNNEPLLRNGGLIKNNGWLLKENAKTEKLLLVDLPNSDPKSESLEWSIELPQNSFTTRPYLTVWQKLPGTSISWVVFYYFWTVFHL